MVFKQINTDDQNLELVQDNISVALKPLESQPMFGGNLLQNITLTSAQDNLIQHGLDHTPVIFFVGNQNVDTRVWSPVVAAAPLNGARSNRTLINFRCSTTCVVSIWVN